MIRFERWRNGDEWVRFTVDGHDVDALTYAAELNFHALMWGSTDEIIHDGLSDR